MNDECERFPCERNKKLYFFCGLYLLKLSFVIIILQKLLLKIGGSKTWKPITLKIVKFFFLEFLKIGVVIKK